MRTSTILIALLLGVCVLIAQSTAAGKTPLSPDRRLPMLVSTSWMAEHLTDSSVIIIHVAQNRREYKNGHIPGARFLWSQALTYTNPDLTVELPSLIQADSTLSNLGISDSLSIVLYFAESNVTPTARVYLTLDHLGLADRVSLLDGGLDAWKRSGHTVSTEPVMTPREKCALHPKEVTVDWQWVRDNLDNSKVSIVDARAVQFFGGNGGGMPRPGHIPNAVNIPFASVVDSANGFKDVASLTKIFETVGIRPGDTVVSYCHIGQQASLIYFVARYLGLRCTPV